MAGTLRRRGIIAEINVTPLVDIMLVLLIIFMLTAHLIARQSIEVDLPHASQSTSSKATPLTITMQDDGSIYLRDKRVGAAELSAAVQAEVAKDPNVLVLLAGGSKVPHGNVVWLLDLIQNLGVTQFAIQVDRAAAIPPKEP
jgi:biopolymer transport protein ExbD|nr:biopolymer transporter ExbD [Kofleriaceae bacterium]